MVSVESRVLFNVWLFLELIPKGSAMVTMLRLWDVGRQQGPCASMWLLFIVSGIGLCFVDDGG